MDESTVVAAPLVRTSFQLPREQISWLEERARRTQSRSVAHEVRVLIAAAMEEEARQLAAAT